MNRQADDEKYLLGEIGEEDREALENRVFTDDEYFFDMLDKESELVDRYVAGHLKGGLETRLETAAAANPNLAAKAANARALRDFVTSEGMSERHATDPPLGFWERVRALFTFGPIPSLAFGGSFLLIAASCAFLFVENGRRNSEIARLQSELSDSRSSGRETELESDLRGSKTRETELLIQIDEERDISGDLASDLARERENRRRLERDVAILKKSDIPENGRSGEETISVLRLDPNLSTDADVPKLNSDGGPERVSFLISIPVKLPVEERVSLRLNGREIARNVATRQDTSGVQQVSTVIYRRQLGTGQNIITVHDAAGKELTSYKVQGGQPQ